MSFWGELKRRNVYKVGVAYAIVAWLIIQAAAIVSPALHLPEWTLPLIIILLSIGFLITLFLAWAYEVTPEGIKRTKEVPLAESITHLTGRKLNYILAGVIVLAMAYIVFDKIYFDRRTTVTQQIPAVSDVEKAKKTIAVLPFVNLSSDPEQEYFVDGLSEEILNSLAQIPGLNVTGRTSSFTFKGSNKKTQEIANELGVENILEGSVRKAGNALRITAQLLRGKDGFHLWSETYDRELKDIFQVQEDIAKAVADELKITLGIDHHLRILGGTNNEKTYELYLFAQGLMNEGTYTAMRRGLEYADAAISLDPEYALGLAFKSGMHTASAVLDPDLDIHRISSEYDLGLQAAQRAIEIEPNLAAGYVFLAQSKSFRGNWVEAELALRKAFELTTEPITSISPSIPQHYNAVGNFERAKKMMEEAIRNNPLDGPNRSWYIFSLGLLGDSKRAEEEYERSKVLFGDPWNWGNSRITIVRLDTENILSPEDIIYSDPIFDAAKEHLDSPKEGLAELRLLYANGTQSNEIGLGYITISIWAAYFGDHEFALEVMDKACSLNANYIMTAWLPVMQKLRQMTRFKEFVREIGLVDYWNEYGWPDICHQLDNGDFECD